MAVSRRSLLGRLGAAAFAGASLPALADSLRAGQLTVSPGSPSNGPILLNNNENAYGPSGKVLAAMQRSLSRANRFPFIACNDLLDQICAAHRVKPNQVILGCGSSEVLRAAAGAFLRPGKTMIVSSPTYEVITDYATAAGGSIQRVPLDKYLANDLDGILGRVNTSTGLIYISNPNNPTAILNPRGDLETFLHKLPGTVRLIIDEAYHHFAGNSASYASFIDRPVDDDRLIVTRTFSKVYGLAGLRVGYGVAAPKTGEQIAFQSVNDNISVVAAEAAVAALNDTQSLELNIQRNADVRQEFMNQAYARMMRPVDTHANFVMFKTVYPADDLIGHFRLNNILIGPHYLTYPNYIRVSMGLPEEMKEFWRVWDLMPVVNKMAM